MNTHNHKRLRKSNKVHVTQKVLTFDAPPGEAGRFMPPVDDKFCP